MCCWGTRCVAWLLLLFARLSPRAVLYWALGLWGCTGVVLPQLRRANALVGSRR
jgi:hypothetical protein